MGRTGREGAIDDREHDSVVELGTEAGSSIASRNFRKFRAAGRRDSRCLVAA